MKTQLLIVLSTLSSLASGQVSIFVGSAGQPGEVLVVGQTQWRPTELMGITLLPLDCVGRTKLTELVEGHARLRTDIPGAARLLLPGDRGSLYKYRRESTGDGASFGFFLVRPSGIPCTLFELGGTGIMMEDDPFPGNLAVCPDGRTFLVASSREAGGDLWEVTLTATATNRTSQLPPLDFAKNGLVLLDKWGLGVARDGVYRFDRALNGGGARSVDLPIIASWFGPDVVHSADQSTVAFLAGDQPERAFVLAARRRSLASLVSDRAMNIPNAGFLPEDPSGPALALSTDGSWAAWRAVGISREVFAGEVRLGLPGPSQHVTGASHFGYTLNDTGVISFFDHDSAVLVAGRELRPGIDRGDLFRIDVTPDGFTARNLTQTSSISQPPFDYGTLSTDDGLFQVPWSSSSFVTLDRGTGRLLWVDAGGRVTEFVDRVQSLDSLDVTGTYMVAGITRPPGVDDPLTETLNIVQIPGGGLGATLIPLPNGCHLTRTVGSRTLNLFSAVLELPGGERLGRFEVPSPSGMSVSPALLTFGPTTGLSPDGAVLATVRVALEQAAFSWTEYGTTLLKMTRGESFLLPGL